MSTVVVVVVVVVVEVVRTVWKNLHGQGQMTKLVVVDETTLNY